MTTRMCSFVVLLLASSVGCALVEDVLPDAPVALSDDARLPEDAPGFESATVSEDAIVYRFADGSEDFALEAGDIVVGAEGGGYLRRVTAVTRDGSTVTIGTEQATLSDAVERGQLSVEVSSAGASAGIGCPDDAFCRAIDVADLAGTVLFDDDIDGVPVTIEITAGSITFDPTVLLDLAIDGGRIEHLSTSAEGVLDVVLDLRASAGGPFQLEQEIDVSGPELPLYSYPFTVLVPTPIGPWPVVGRLDVELFAGVVADFDAQAELTAGVEATASILVGAEYDGAAWQLFGEPAITATPHPPVLTGSASADLTLYLRPEARLVLYGVTGPVVSLVPSLHLTGAARAPEPPSFTLEGCLEGRLDVAVDVLGVDLPEYHDAIERCTDLPQR